MPPSPQEAEVYWRGAMTVIAELVSRGAESLEVLTLFVACHIQLRDDIDELLRAEAQQYKLSMADVYESLRLVWRTKQELIPGQEATQPNWTSDAWQVLYELCVKRPSAPIAVAKLMGHTREKLKPAF